MNVPKDLTSEGIATESSWMYSTGLLLVPKDLTSEGIATDITSSIPLN